MKQKKDNLKAEQPIAIAAEGQAPVIPFAPYKNHDDYEADYSSTLIDKSNDLARKIWSSQEGYEASKVSVCPSSAIKKGNDAAAKNYALFSRRELDREVNRVFSIGVHSPDAWGQRQKIVDLIKKLKRLERRYELEDLFGDDDHEMIVQNALLPTSQFGVCEVIGESRYANFHYPTRPALVNGQLTAEDIVSLEYALNFIPAVREILYGFKPWSDVFSEEKLLEPLNSLPGRGVFGLKKDREFLLRLRDAKSFFERVFPTLLVHDLIPKLRYPSEEKLALTSLQAKSADLRDSATAFIQREKPLSALLEKILELSDALKNYFGAVISELSAYFGYLDHIGMPYETLVKESSQRIREGDVPW